MKKRNVYPGKTKPGSMGVLSVVLILFGGLAAEPVGAMTPEAAVAAAKGMPDVDWSEVRGNADALGALADAAGGTAQFEALRENGQGVLFAPGRADADACHKATDPRCRAVQIVDRLAEVPNPVDPDLSGGLMAGRDDVVATAPDRVDLTNGVTSSTGSCRPITTTVTVPPETHTCEKRTVTTGGDETTKRCAEEWIAILDEASRWACRIAWFTRRELACTVPVEVPQDRTQTFVCYEGAKDPAIRTCPVTVTPQTRPMWSAVCLEPRYAVKKKACDKRLVVSAQATCTPGTFVEAVNRDAAVLGEDAVTGLDRLRVRYGCVQESGAPKIEIATNATGSDFNESFTTRESTFDVVRVVHEDTWRVAGSIDCAADNGCTARVTMTVYDGTGTNHVLTGSLTCVLAFNRFAIGQETDRWIETCTESGS